MITRIEGGGGGGVGVGVNAPDASYLSAHYSGSWFSLYQCIINPSRTRSTHLWCLHDCWYFWRAGASQSTCTNKHTMAEHLVAFSSNPTKHKTRCSNNMMFFVDGVWVTCVRYLLQHKECVHLHTRNGSSEHENVVIIKRLVDACGWVVKWSSSWRDGKKWSFAKIFLYFFCFSSRVIHPTDDMTCKLLLLLLWLRKKKDFNLAWKLNASRICFKSFLLLHFELRYHSSSRGCECVYLYREASDDMTGSL